VAKPNRRRSHAGTDGLAPPCRMCLGRLQEGRIVSWRTDSGDSRIAAKSALVAVAHTILVLVYRSLATGQPYQERGVVEVNEQKRLRLIRHHVRRAWVGSASLLHHFDWLPPDPLGLIFGRSGQAVRSSQPGDPRHGATALDRLGPLVGVKRACQALSVPCATWYRRRKTPSLSVASAWFRIRKGAAVFGAGTFRK
jgi:hypothetical protein